VRRALYAAAFVLLAAPLSAQRVTLGVDATLMDYREQGPALRFSGGGASAHAGVGFWRLFADARVMAVHVEGASTDGDPTDAFDIAQGEFRLGMQVTRRLAAEVGGLFRKMEPEHAAQSMRAWRAGGVFIQPLAPGADLAVRAAYLGATHFGGGGTAPFGMDVGLAVSYGPGAGRYRLTAEYEFQRVDRRTTIGGQQIDVPIQSAIARIGVAATFGR
jgi:hypothetical protein